MIYEHGELWWNDTDRGKLLIHPPELPDNPTSRYLVAKHEELAMEMMNFALQSISFHTSKGSLKCRKILQHGADGFTDPPKEGVLWIFIALKNPSPSARFQHMNLGAQWQSR
jgi:hypothetical protein